MKNTLIMAVVTIVVVYSTSLFSQEAGSTDFRYIDKVYSQKDTQYKIEKTDLFTQIKSDLFGPIRLTDKKQLICSSLKSNLFDSTGKLNSDQPKEKSVWIGIGLSTVLPGGGEYYGKSYVKAAIFFGIEAISWGIVFYYNHKGNVQTDKFQDFAKQNWSVHRYAQWLVDQQFPGAGVINPNEQNLELLRSEVNQCEAQNFSHQLAEYYTQDYFEIIGKYQNFQPGWIGANQVLNKNNFQTVRLPIFVNYSYDRQKANDYYNLSTTGSTITIINHFLSMADAAWTIIMYNKHIDVQSGFRMGTYLTQYTYKERPLPTFNIQFSF